MNAPAWFKCENCLFWKSPSDPGEGWGCTYAGIPKPITFFDRCHLWICKRCFSPWNVMVCDADDVVNHLYCKRRGRGKPKANWQNYE